MEENWDKRRDHSVIIAALIFLFLAILFGLIILRQIYIGKFTLPFYVIVVGMFIFATSLEAGNGIGEWIASLGWTLNMFGLLLFYHYGTGNLESWAYSWPLIFPAGIGLGQLSYGAVKALKSPFERGKILVQIGIGLFILNLIVFNLFFQ
ncbi:hypothetical protein RSJ42_17685 [Methanosarcina hadiensis]|uniref:hypothetical protein n=1 Tax=Methanosarcina hadiensis TaxID=3078083 RepID=UPI003977461A